jgi:[CysO sulfur-carrier protein]-S-L-cysteine hydrolase
VKIAQALLDAMVAHAREDQPDECCGMVGGIDGEAKTVYRARNEFESPLRFGVDSDDLFRITQREMPDRGEELLVIYHSHTKTAAYPSQTDVNMAQNSWPDAIWVIISLADESAPDLRGYLLKDLKIADAPLEIT